MTQLRLLRIFMLGAALFSFTLVGCGDDDGETGEATDVDTLRTDDAADLGDGDLEDLKESMIEMSQEMHEIVIDIESVEDVRDADEEIGDVFDDLVENLRTAMKKNPAAMQRAETELADDPEMKEWSQKMDAAMASLRADHPEAADELDRVMQKHSMKLMALVGEMMQNMNPEAMEGTIEGMEEGGDTVDEGN